MSLLLALAVLSADPSDPAAKLGVLLGAVEIKAAGAAEYAPATAGAAIENDTWVRTGPGARAALDFADGTELRLNENT